MRIVASLNFGMVLVIAAVGAASAATCGDADGNGSITVTDGVQTLRVAAELPSTCTGRVCDADGRGQVTVSDGVVILRAAASLPAKLSCGTEIAGLFGGVTKVLGAASARLELGAPPTPGASSTLGTPVGRDAVRMGRSVAYSVPYDLDAPADLVVAARDGFGGTRFEGFYALALPAGSGTVELVLPTERDEAAASFIDVEFFTRTASTVSSVSNAPLDIIRFANEVLPFCLGGPNADAECTSDSECPGGLCGDRECVSGANAGGHCVTDGDCPGGGCADGVGCLDGPNEEQPCSFNSECPESVCRPD